MNFAIFTIPIFLFLPGLLTLLVFKLDNIMDILELITSSLFLSIMINSLIPTIIAYFGGGKELFIPGILIYIIVFGMLTIILKRRPRPKRGSREDLLLLIPLITLIIILAIHLYKYPFFHGTMSRDPYVHATYLKNILTGNVTKIVKTTNYPLGLHMIGSIIILITKINPVYVIRYFTSYLVILSIPIIYIMIRRLFNGKTAFWTTFIYHIVFLIEYFHFSDMGTYPNILGDIYTMFILFWWFLICNSKIDRFRYAGYILVSFGLVTSALWTHYSTFIIVTLIPIISPLVYRVKKDKNIFIEPLIFITVLIFMLSDARFLNAIQNIFNILKGGPLLMYHETEIYNLIRNYVPQLIILGWLSIFTGIHFYIILLGIIYVIYEALNKRKPSFIVVIIWIIYIILWSLQGGNVTRLMRLIMLPISITYGYMVAGLEGKINLFFKYKIIKYSHYSKILITIFILLLLPSFSTLGYLNSLIKNVDFERQKQFDILNSMYWIKDNIPRNKTILCVGVRDYKYFNILCNENRRIIFLAPNYPEYIINITIFYDINYIIIWKKLHIDLQNIVDKIKENKLFKVKFENTNIIVFYKKGESDN